jgi:hypothetical protein
MQRQRVLPPAARGGHIRAPLFVGVYGFLTVNPKRPIVRHSVLSAAVVGSAVCNSTSVASGRAVIRAIRRSSCWGDKLRLRNFVCLRGSIEPVSRRRCTKRWTHARLTSYLAATL